jgi:hypothetical protein
VIGNDEGMLNARKSVHNEKISKNENSRPAQEFGSRLNCLNRLQSQGDGTDRAGPQFWRSGTTVVRPK